MNMSYNRMLKIIMQPWLTIEDIQELSNCSRNAATTIIQIIEENVVKNGKMLPICKTKIVPTKLVLELLSLDEDYIYSMAIKEQRIKHN